jgi:hypothetical protein
MGHVYPCLEPGAYLIRMRTLEEELDRFLQVCGGLLDAGPLAGDIQFGT